ncbi:hypothetical protein [Actinoplanes sp. TBRC 11911]|uniref:hypothetical protein n=1 Tax=Actinoplanes sp. TBRC 11911 TaxID=2729386 RepID=UPI0037BF569F
MLAELEQVGEDAAKLAAAPVWPVSDDELTDLLRAAHRLQQAAVVLQARLVRQATTRGLPAAQGHRSTAGWLRSLLMLDPQPARELAEAAAASARPAIEQAMLDGHTDARQAAVIAATVEAISAGLRRPHPAHRARQRRADPRHRPRPPAGHRAAPPRPAHPRPRLCVSGLRPPTTLERRAPMNIRPRLLRRAASWFCLLQSAEPRHLTGNMRAAAAPPREVSARSWASPSKATDVGRRNDPRPPRESRPAR